MSTVYRWRGFAYYPPGRYGFDNVVVEPVLAEEEQAVQAQRSGE